MEDAHIAKLDLPDGCSIFGVFDGHGGREVSRFVADNYVKLLIDSPEFKAK